MRTEPECYACFFRQALDAARVAGCSPAQQLSVMRSVARAATDFDPKCPPVQMGRTTHRIVRQISGSSDPYAALKRRSNEAAARLLPDLRRRVAAADDPLEAAVRAAIAGNVIDFGAQSLSDVPDLEATAAECFAGPMAVDHVQELRVALGRARTVLVIGDNAGECVFDALLLEQLEGLAVAYAVRSSPVLNDALREDAVAAGLDRLARVEEWGCDAPGALLSACRPAMRAVFDAADVVIAKGQGNLECLGDAPRSIFFLLRVKCQVVAAHLGHPLGSLVALEGGNEL